MHENYKKFIDPNIKRKSDIIQNSLQFYKNNKIPLFSLVEISDSGTCNRSCSFCPRSDKEWIKKFDNKEFIEWEEVYENTYYGTLISELENSSQKNLIFDIDVVGGLNIKKKFPKQTMTIFIKPPSINELETRLINRNLDSGSSIKTRINKAKDEILLADKFDYIVENNILEISYSKVLELVKSFING